MILDPKKHTIHPWRFKIQYLLFVYWSAWEIFYLFLILFGVRLPCCGSHAWLPMSLRLRSCRGFYFLFTSVVLTTFEAFWLRGLESEKVSTVARPLSLFFRFCSTKSKRNKSKQNFSVFLGLGFLVWILWQRDNEVFLGTWGLFLNWTKVGWLICKTEVW